MERVGEALFQESPRWIWHDRVLGVHASVPIRRYHLHEAHEAILERIQQEFNREIENIQILDDHLNVEFRPAALVGWMEDWAADQGIFRQEVAFPDQVELPVRELRSGWGELLRSAEALAGIPGWDAPCGCGERCNGWVAVPMVLLRQAEVLRTGTGDSRQRQLLAIEAMVMQLRGLWILPILHPLEPVDSALRQRIMRLLVGFARRAGARWDDL